MTDSIEETEVEATKYDIFVPRETEELLIEHNLDTDHPAVLVRSPGGYATYFHAVIVDSNHIMMVFSRRGVPRDVMVSVLK